MRVYRASKKRKKAKILFFVLSFLFALIVAIISYLRFIITPIILDATYYQVDSLATTYISDAILYTIKSSDYDYSDFVSIKYSSDGKVSSIISNSINLNKFAREVASISQVYIDKVAKDGIDIPIGTFSGISFLNGRGASINFKLVTIGSILTSFDSAFKSVGINQTLHQLSIIVNTTVAVITPLATENIEFNTNVLICENLIVGEVPSVYLSGNLFK